MPNYLIPSMSSIIETLPFSTSLIFLYLSLFLTSTDSLTFIYFVCFYFNLTCMCALRDKWTPLPQFILYLCKYKSHSKSFGLHLSSRKLLKMAEIWQIKLWLAYLFLKNITQCHIIKGPVFFDISKSSPESIWTIFFSCYNSILCL